MPAARPAAAGRPRPHAAGRRLPGDAAPTRARSARSSRRPRRVVTTSGWTRRLAARRLRACAPDRVHVGRAGRRPGRAGRGHRRRAASCCASRAVTPGQGARRAAAALAIVADLPWRCVCVGTLDRRPGLRRPTSAARPRAAGIERPGAVRGPARRAPTSTARTRAPTSSCCASRAETYGMVVTEALARGLPVVATAVGGLPRGARRASPTAAAPGCWCRPATRARSRRRCAAGSTDADLRERLRRPPASAGARRCPAGRTRRRRSSARARRGGAREPRPGGRSCGCSAARCDPRGPRLAARAPARSSTACGWSTRWSLAAAAAHRAGDHRVLRLAVAPGRARPRRRAAAARRPSRRTTGRSSSTRRCPAACSATCTAACSHGRDVGDVGRALRAVVWERSAGQVVQLVLALVVLLAGAVARARGHAARRVAVAGGGSARLVGRRWSRALPRRPVPARPRTVRAARTRPARRAAGAARLAGHRARLRARRGRAPRDVPDRRPDRRVGRVAAPSCCRWRCSCWWPWACRPTSPAGGRARAWPPGRSASAGLGAAQGVTTAVVYGVLVSGRQPPGSRRCWSRTGSGAGDPAVARTRRSRPRAAAHG